MPIRTVRVLYPRVGRVSLGYMAVRMNRDGTPFIGKGGKPVTYPRRSNTFVFHSDTAARLEEVARVFGGKVEPSLAGDVEGGHFRVITRATQVKCFLPAGDERGFDAWFELWGASGLIRRCDGERCQFAVDLDTGEVKRDIPCVCDALDLEGDDRCSPTTRMNIVIPALGRAPGIGVWQVQSRGWGTHRALASTIDLLNQIGRVAMVPMLMKAEIRQTRVVVEGKARTRDIPIITLEAEASFVEMMAHRHEGEVPALPEPDRNIPPIGAVLTEEQKSMASEEEALNQALLDNIAALGLSVEERKALSGRVTGKMTRAEYTIDDYAAMVAVTKAMLQGKTVEEALSPQDIHKGTEP